MNTRALRGFCIGFACVLLLSSGCTSSKFSRAVFGNPQNQVLNVVFNSSPPGAVLYYATTNFGTCPVALQWQLTPEQKRRKAVVLKLPVAAWPSGATSIVTEVTADLRMHGYRQEYTFTHPDRDGPRRAFDSLGHRSVSAKVYSNPLGATIYYDGVPLGESPVIIQEAVTMENFEHDSRGDKARLRPIKAIWMSGASSIVTGRVVSLASQDEYPLIPL